jgi:hypothetical protein
MPRDRRANIGTGLWFESTVRSLTRRQQQAYFLAYTQPDVSRCGVVPYRLRSWAGLSLDGTESEIHEDFLGLHATRHVVLDVVDEQLLIRTYVKHDGLLSQPLVVASMIRDYHRISSPLIRVAFLAEIRRLWEDPDLEPAHHRGLELILGAPPADLGVRGPEKIAAAIGSGLLGALIDAIADGQVEPYPAKGLPKGLTEGQREGLTKGLGNPWPDPRYNARAPVPATVPATDTAPATATAPTEPPPDAAVDRLLAEHAAAYAEPLAPSVFVAVRREVWRLAGSGVAPERIRAGLTKMRAKNLSPRLLAQLVAETTPLAAHETSTTNQRVGAALALADQYEAREQA